MENTNEKTELPQFIQHNGYCHREGGRVNGGGDIFQLFVSNPALMSEGKKKLICYGNPINTTFEIYCKNINDGFSKIKELLDNDKSWQEVDKQDFVDQWGEKDFNWLSKLS